MLKHQTHPGQPTAEPQQSWRFVQRGWAIHPILTAFAVTMALTLLLGLVGLIADPRLITGMPAWAKTVKFSISLLIYAITLIWMLPFVTQRTRWAMLAANVIGVMLWIEMAVVLFQTARGVPSHFNVATELDAALWSMMAIAIMILWLCNMVIAGVLFVQRGLNPAFAWGLRLAMLITIVGLGLGYLMPGPKGDQLERLARGEQVAYVGGHTVGAPDGGAGLPLLGWSTQHGDLRIGHFLGIHALQVVALFGWWIGHIAVPWLSSRRRVALTWLVGAGYLALTLLSTWQALRDQPLIRPDTLTLGALVGLIVVLLIGAVAILGPAWQRKERVNDHSYS